MRHIGGNASFLIDMSLNELAQKVSTPDHVSVELCVSGCVSYSSAGSSFLC